MPYRLLIESFAKKEFRAVFVPKARGGRRPGSVSQDETDETQFDSDSGHPQVYAPPRAGAGGGVSGSGSPPLVDACDFVMRSDSDLAKFSSWGRKARAALRRAGEAADMMDPDPSHWAFFTLTFPACAEGANEAIANNSGWVVQRVKNILAPYGAKESAFFYVWERQARGTLHLHFCHRVEGGFELSFIPERVRTLSAKMVTDLSKKTGVNLWIGRNNVDWSQFPSKLRLDYQLVRKNVGRYLAKYCSKDAEFASKKWAELNSPSPQRWWGCSESLKEAVASLTVVQRYNYSDYLSASNAFDSVVDKMMLYKSDGVDYSGDIRGTIGRYYSMFRSKPCQRLPIFMQSASIESIWRSTTMGEGELLLRYSIFDFLTPEVCQTLNLIGSKAYSNVFEIGCQEDYQLALTATYASCQSELLANHADRWAMAVCYSAWSWKLRWHIPKHRSLQKKLLLASQALRTLSASIRGQPLEPFLKTSTKNKEEYEQMSFL